MTPLPIALLCLLQLSIQRYEWDGQHSYVTLMGITAEHGHLIYQRSIRQVARSILSRVPPPGPGLRGHAMACSSLNHTLMKENPDPTRT